MVRADAHLVPLSVGPDSSSDLSITLVEFPVQLPPREFAHVVLLEDAHGLLDLGWDAHNVDLAHALVLGGGISAFIWPVSGGQDLNIDIKIEHLVRCRSFKILHPLLGHLDVFEHDLESLSELEATLLL